MSYQLINTLFNRASRPGPETMKITGTQWQEGGGALIHLICVNKVNTTHNSC